MFETDPSHYRIATYFHSNSSCNFTTLRHLLYHLHRLHHRSPLSSTLAPRTKPRTYRAINFIFGHQSCHYSTDFDTLTIDAYVYLQSSLYFISDQDTHTRHDHYTLHANHDDQLSNQNIIQQCSHHHHTLHVSNINHQIIKQQCSHFHQYNIKHHCSYVNSRILNSSVVTLNIKKLKSSVIMSNSRILNSSVVVLKGRILHSSLTLPLSIIMLNSRILNSRLTLLLSVIMFNISLNFFLLTFYYYTFDV